MSAYYNEIDPFAATWLRNLIAAGHIAPGYVDERSIREVSGDDLRGYRQCHFFAGIGVWSYALRLARWADDAPVWTGSCPCQPFSAAGKRGGASDDRHLWPEFFRLIRECRPAIVLGEQVAGKAGYGWWDSVSADLEGEDYAGAAADLAAAGAGAPHIRQRIFWMAHRHGIPRGQGRSEFRGGAVGGDALEGAGPCSGREPVGLADGAISGRDAFPIWAGRQDGRATPQPGRLCDAVGLADANGRNAGAERQQRGGEQRQQPEDGRAVRMEHAEGERHGTDDLEPVTRWRELAIGQADGARAVGLGFAPSCGRERERDQPAHGIIVPAGAQQVTGPGEWPGPLNGHWRDADWLRCTDARWRPVEPSAFPLAHGVAGRVGRLRAYGNAINAPLAAEFIRAAREALEDVRAA